MNEVHVCDFVLRPAPWQIDSNLFARARRKIADICAFASTLFQLEWGEPIWVLVPGDKALMLRLNLAPRKCGWTFDVRRPGPRRPQSLAEEGEAVFAQLQRSGLKFTRAAGQLKAAANAGPITESDPVFELLCCQSRKTWLLRRGSAETQLEFPDMDITLVDQVTTELSGTVTLVAPKRLELKRVSGPSSLRALATLIVARSDTSAQTWSALARIDSVVKITVRLHRCLFTRRIVGASLVTPSAIT